MINYIDYITELLMKARKDKDIETAEVLKLIKAKLIEFTTQKNAPKLNKQAFILVIKKMEKEVLGDLEIATKADRTDLVNKNTIELNILRQFIPKEATAGEITEWLDTYIKEPITKKNMGLVIKEIKNAFDSVDEALVAQLVKDRVNND